MRLLGKCRRQCESWRKPNLFTRLFRVGRVRPKVSPTGTGYLPAARKYLLFLEERTGVEVGCVSTGPERNQTVQRSNTLFAAAIAQ